MKHYDDAGDWIENRMSQNPFQYEWHSSATTTPRLTKKWITCLVTKSIHLVFKFSLLFTNIHFASHYLVTTLRNFTILLLPLAFLHHHTLYMWPLFRCLTCVIITLVLQTSSFLPYLFGVCLSGVVLPIFLDVGSLKMADPIISSGMTPAKKIIRTMELLTELNWWVWFDLTRWTMTISPQSVVLSMNVKVDFSIKREPKWFCVKRNIRVFVAAYPVQLWEDQDQMFQIGH